MGSDRIAFLMVVQTEAMHRDRAKTQAVAGKTVALSAQLTEDDIAGGLTEHGGDFHAMALEFIEWANGGTRPEWVTR